MKEKKAIAVWSITNTSSLIVWEMKADEAMLVGINDDVPEWFEIEYREPDEEWENEEEMVAGIDFHGTFWKLSECMRVNQ